MVQQAEQARRAADADRQREAAQAREQAREQGRQRSAYGTTVD
jgi:hypothetical protein